MRMRASLLALGMVAAASSAASCSSDARVPDSPATCDRQISAGNSIEVGAVLPNLRFEGLRENGESGSFSLHDYSEPCAAASKLLVLRVTGGSWCGTCRWSAAHTGELKALPTAARMRWVDLLLGDEDNNPARASDVAGWQKLLDAPAGTALGVDPAFRLSALGKGRGLPLPLFVLIDTRTMKVLSYTANPDPDRLIRQLESTMAELDAAPPPTPKPEVLVEQLFHRNEWDMIREMAAPEAPPPDPSNAVADSPAAAALGKKLFFDTSLSPSGEVSCASCHQTEHGLSDSTPVARAAGVGTRRTPRITLAAHQRWQFWDGRVDSLWAQALAPFENPAEFNSSRLRVVRRVMAGYGSDYRAAFPAAPAPSTSAWPADGKPGDAAYDALPEGERQAATQTFVNIGKAIAAYERSFRTKPTALDAYARGDKEALTIEQKQGLSTFFSASCTQCHWGPTLSDGAFHVTRVGTGRADGAADQGRSGGIVLWSQSEFSRGGRWSDAPHAAPSFDLAPNVRTLGAFKTPSLRGVATSAPFGHGGTQVELVSVVDAYGVGGLLPSDSRAIGTLDPWLPKFGEATSWAMMPFLLTLEDKPLVP